MGKILEMDFFSISFYKIKNFLKRNKKRIFFIGLFVILFFILFENGLADPVTDPKVDSKIFTFNKNLYKNYLITEL